MLYIERCSLGCVATNETFAVVVCKRCVWVTMGYNVDIDFLSKWYSLHTYSCNFCRVFSLAMSTQGKEKFESKTQRITHDSKLYIKYRKLHIKVQWGKKERK